MTRVKFVNILIAYILIFLMLILNGSIVRTKTEAANGDQIYEAENSEFVGIVNEDDTCSNGQYISITDNNFAENTHVLFTLNIEYAGFYDISIKSRGSQAEKKNIVEIDGNLIQKYLISKADVFTEITFVEDYFFEAGVHTFEILPLYGWISIDYLKLSQAKIIDYDYLFNVTQGLSNPNASNNAKQLYAFLQSSYGKYIISGQHTEHGLNDPDFQKIKEQTGRLPAILGLDLMHYSSIFDIYGEYGEIYLRTAIESAIEFADVGGITTFCWHWSVPKKFLKKDENNEYVSFWKGFRTQYVDMDFASIMSDTTSEDFKLLMNDIDLVAERLKHLTELDIPILFRPLHEASGGWFWWGSGGAQAYIKLWKEMYNRMTNYHNLNNLIWVWNGLSKEWYPGDEYVDIVGEDIYTTPKDYDEHAEQFAKTTDYSDAPKITALTENGTLFDIDEAKKTNTMWAWFLNWHGVHTIPGADMSEEYSELSMWQEVYNHENVITLDELPFHSHEEADKDKVCDVCGAAIKPIDNKPNTPDKNRNIIIGVVVTLVVLSIIGVTIFVVMKRKKRKN